MKTKIYQQFKEAGAQKFKVSKKTAIKYLEETGYYKKGTVEETVSMPKIKNYKEIRLQTPFAIFYFMK